MMDAMDCARFLTTYAHEECDGISNLDLQKMLFLAERAFMSEHGTAMLRDEFYAWQYGIVIPSVYNAYSPAGGEPITRQYDGITCDVSEFEARHPDEAEALIATYRRYAKHRLDLVRDVKDNVAWRNAYDDGRGYGVVIEKSRSVG